VPSRRDARGHRSGPNGLGPRPSTGTRGPRSWSRTAPDHRGGNPHRGVTLPASPRRLLRRAPLGILSPYLRTLPLAEHGLHMDQPPASVAHPLDGEPAVHPAKSLDATADTPAPMPPRNRRLMRPLLRPHELLAEISVRHTSPATRSCSPALVCRRLPATSWGGTWFRGERPGPCRRLRGPLDPAADAAGQRASASCPARSTRRELADRAGRVGRDHHRTRRISPLSRRPHRDGDAGWCARRPPTVAGWCSSTRAPTRSQPSGHRCCPAATWTGSVDSATGRASSRSTGLSMAHPVGRSGMPRIGDRARRWNARRDRGSEAAVWHGRVSDRPYMIVVQPSLFDSSRAPAGKHTGWAYCHVPAGSTLDLTDVLERQVERFAPGFRDRIWRGHVMNTAALEQYNGELTSRRDHRRRHRPRQLFTRPAVRANPYSTPNPDVFICSASTPPGGGVHGMCGYHAARAALRRLASAACEDVAMILVVFRSRNRRTATSRSIRDEASASTSWCSSIPVSSRSRASRHRTVRRCHSSCSRATSP